MTAFQKVKLKSVLNLVPWLSVVIFNHWSLDFAQNTIKWSLNFRERGLSQNLLKIWWKFTEWGFSIHSIHILENHKPSRETFEPLQFTKTSINWNRTQNMKLTTRKFYFYCLLSLFSIKNSKTQFWDFFFWILRLLLRNSWCHFFFVKWKFYAYVINRNYFRCSD